jgi:hypothetical protein
MAPQPVDIGYLLQQWADLGVFDYLLPFLLIFALVYGILSSTNIFRGNKTVNAVIALTIGLLSLQWGFVPQFFSEVFPRAGVGLAVILIIIVTAGFFVDPKRVWIMYTLLGVAAFVAGVVLLNSFGSLGWQSSFILQQYTGWIIFGVIFIIILAIIVGTTSGKDKPEPYDLGPFRIEAK